MYLQSKLISIKNILILFIVFFNTPSILSDEKNYFKSLKYNMVNIRQGPSKDYPVKFTIKKKYLPVKVLDNYENFRKIIDIKNNSGWIHTSQLSNKKTAQNIKENSILLSKPKIYSKPIAKLESGKLVIIKKCKDNWCKIRVNNFLGWIKKDNLWGSIN